MNDDDLFGHDLKALAGPCDAEGALRQIRAKVTAARRRRAVWRGVAAVAVLALVVLAGWGAWQALRPAPVVVITDDYETGRESITSTTAAGAAASGVPEPVEIVTSIARTAEPIGPRLAITVASYEWGAEAGRFGRAANGAGQGPTVFATAPDTQFIAVLDVANSRVQMLEPGGGWRSSPTPLPEGGPFLDLAICADGNLALLAAQEVVLITLDGEVLGRHAIGWDGFLPEQLLRSGADLWIMGTQQASGADGRVRSYPFVLDGEVVPPEAAAEGSREGWVAAGAAFELIQRSSALLQVRITPEQGQPLLWSIVSELPLEESYRPLGSDVAGNYYLAVLVGPPGGGEPAEAGWCVVGLTPTGGQLGQVRWPGVYELGGGFEVSSDGQVYDFQGSASGLRFVCYGLETDVAYVIQPAENLVQGYLEALEARLVARGIEVVSVTTDTGNAADTQLAESGLPPGDVLPLVCVRVPAATLAPPDGIFRRAAIEHEALYMVRHGVPLRILAVTSVNDDGSEHSESLGMLGDLAYSNQWDLPGTVGDEESRALLKEALREAANQAGAALVSLDLGLGDDGFHPHLLVSVEGDVSGQTALVSERALQAVTDLAERGVKIPVFKLSVNSKGGEPLLRSCNDWTIGGGSYSRWSAPGVTMDSYGPPYMSQPVPAPETTVAE